MDPVVAGLTLCLHRCILGCPVRCYGSPLSSNVANTLWSSSSVTLYLVVWCLILLWFSSKGAVGMSVYSLTDAPVQRWSLLKWMFYLSCLQWALAERHPVLNLAKHQVVNSMYHQVWQFFTFIFITGRTVVVFATPKKPVTILEHNTKAFADYMTRESKSSTPFFYGDASSMHNSCKYPFTQKDGQWVNNIKDLQQCSRPLRDTMDDGDIYLSYSFFQLLTRHYFGF